MFRLILDDPDYALPTEWPLRDECPRQAEGVVLGSASSRADSWQLSFDNPR